METKDKIQYGTAIGAMISGAILSYCSFFLTGDVAGGVLTYTGIMVSFAGAVFGITVYGQNKLAEIERNANDKLTQIEAKYQSLA